MELIGVAYTVNGMFAQTGTACSWVPICNALVKRDGKPSKGGICVSKDGKAGVFRPWKSGEIMIYEPPNGYRITIGTRSFVCERGAWYEKHCGHGEVSQAIVTFKRGKWKIAATCGNCGAPIDGSLYYPCDDKSGLDGFEFECRGCSKSTKIQVR